MSSQRAAFRVSFSSWTLPHELARLVLAEQLYVPGRSSAANPTTSDA
jgi:23S rRNA pseudoU1915 N3-methylase RlmH